MTAIEIAPIGEPLWFLRNLIVVHVSGEQTGGRVAVVEMWGPPGDAPPPHVHREEDEVFHVLEGRIELLVQGREPQIADAGCDVVAPLGVPHVYRVTDDAPARWLIIVSPARFDGLVRALARPAGAPILPPDPEPPDPAVMAETAARFGIEILGTPGAAPWL
jgi:quercetin dioxygenase-like cupin family protein